MNANIRTNNEKKYFIRNNKTIKTVGYLAFPSNCMKAVLLQNQLISQKLILDKEKSIFFLLRMHPLFVIVYPGLWQRLIVSFKIQ